MTVAKLDAIQPDADGYRDIIEGMHVDTDNVLDAFVRSIAPEVAAAADRVMERAGDWWYA